MILLGIDVFLQPLAELQIKEENSEG